MKEVAVPQAKTLLEHFPAITDCRQPCKVIYSLKEVLLLVVCGTMAACDDYNDIVLWGNTGGKTVMWWTAWTAPLC